MFTKDAFVQPVSAQANPRSGLSRAQRGGRSQNRLHVQKALMEYLLLGRDVH
jgi:hypothetical protein